MAEVLSFDNSAAVKYERYMVPLIFQPYAEIMAERVAKLNPSHVLEIAAGTGVVTRALAAALPESCEIVATDLAEGMLDVAREYVPEGSPILWQQADGQDLPFEDESFDVVVCQFGIMFFPDKIQGFREAHRVLKPGGTVIFNSWASLAENPTFDLAFNTAMELMNGKLPNLMEVPFGYTDEDQIRSDMGVAGIESIEIEAVSTQSNVTSAQGAALGYIQGGPMTGVMKELGGDIPEITAKVAAAIELTMGSGPFQNPLKAILMTGKKL